MERGIMFSTPMLQAYLRGDKNQTRRMKGLAGINLSPDDWKFLGFVRRKGEIRISKAQFEFRTGGVHSITLPYGYEGDSFWFRETYSVTLTGIKYRADGWEEVQAKYNIKWKSSMFMPKSLSRFREIPIIDVRVQRLQDITWEDAVAEGIPHTFPSIDRQQYFELFDSVNKTGPKSSSNPWVWVYKFPIYNGA